MSKTRILKLTRGNTGAIVELVLKIQQAREPFIEKESAFNEQLVQLRINWATFMEQTNNQLKLAA